MKQIATIALFTFINITIMAKEIKTSISINATPEQVWKVLTDFKSYPKWNPFILSLEGNVAVGNKIKAKIAPPESKSMTFKPKVLEFAPNKKFVWLGHLLFKGIFDGQHQFELIDNGDGTTLFIQSERFSGILKGMLNLEKTKRGFESMNEKLKEVVEQES